MKKILMTILLSMLSLPSLAQTTNDLEAKLQQLKAENESLISQNTGFDTKIQTKQKELNKTEKELKELQAKRSLSTEACSNISEKDLELMQGLSAGTILISGAGALAGTYKNTTHKRENNKTQTDNTETVTETETTTTTATTIHTPSTADKVFNIATTVTSAGSTTTSAIALSKVEGLKNNIKKCLESFN